MTILLTTKCKNEAKIDFFEIFQKHQHEDKGKSYLKYVSKLCFFSKSFFYKSDMYGHFVKNAYVTKIGQRHKNHKKKGKS